MRLGQLCGLMLNQAPPNDQLHSVISITGNLQETDTQEVADKDIKSPVKRLKENISPNVAFERNYLKMCLQALVRQNANLFVL